MPRQSRGPASAPRRPTVQQRPTPPTQARPASTSAAPPQTQAPPQAQSGGGSGLFGQMASTAAGVAVGSSIGHAVGGWFGGGSSAAQAEQQAAPIDQQHDNGMYQSSAMSQNNAAQGVCANDINNFRTCMDQNQGNLTICGWYLDQLKACQQAASQY